MKSTPTVGATMPSLTRSRLSVSGLLALVALGLGALVGLLVATIAFYGLSHAGRPADLIPVWVRTASIAAVGGAVAAIALYNSPRLIGRVPAASRTRIGGLAGSGATRGRWLGARFAPNALVVVLVAAVAVVFAPFNSPALGTTRDFPIPGVGKSGSHAQVEGITAGPDGNLWFTEVGSNQIGRISPQGTVRLFPIPTASSQPLGITTGPDGNLWFTEAGSSQIGRMTPTGATREFTLTAPRSEPFGITAGPDGNLWFTEAGSNQVGRITPAGAVHQFLLPINSSPTAIATGPDGNLWFTAGGLNEIGRITPMGSIRLFSIPTANSQPFGITAGPDGNLWFTEIGSNQIGRITLAGAVREYRLSASSHGRARVHTPAAITAGPDGNLWFTVIGEKAIGRISTLGAVSIFNAGTAEGRLDAIASGPDGYLWFAYDGANVIGRIAP